MVVADELRIGVSRLASYEAGRVPVPYEVAKRFVGAFGLNLEWLAEEKGEPTDFILISASLENHLGEHALFTHVYDRLIKPGLREPKSAQSHFEKAVQSNPEAAKMTRFVRTIGASKLIVDTDFISGKVSDVSLEIPTWKELVSILRSKTKAAGAKAALAKHLGTSRQNLNKWLRGKGAPSAKLTLEVLRWVKEH